MQLGAEKKPSKNNMHSNATDENKCRALYRLVEGYADIEKRNTIIGLSKIRLWI